MKTGYLFLGAAAILYYCSSLTTQTGFDGSSGLGSIEAQLADFNAIPPAPLPNLDVILAGVGVFLLWKGHTL